MLKLARGHAAYELSEPQLDEPSEMWCGALTLMAPEQREAFETPPSPSGWPEIGSRAFQRAAANWPDGSQWVIVQPDRYRYCAVAEGEVLIRVVLSEFIGAEVLWRDMELGGRGA